MTDQPNPAALKEIFDRNRLRHFVDQTRAISSTFDAERFYAHATQDLDGLGIMQRMRRTAEAFALTLPQDYENALGVLAELAPRIGHGFAAITLCEFVVLRGGDDFDRSMEALRLFTRYGSGEFAIRHFLKRDLHCTLAVMRRWAEDENEHVRRLSSEGARPRLPWSFQLREIVADPALTMPILDTLKADPSLYVRKSVANHLNDFSKDHPEWLVDRLGCWPLDDPHTQWIVGHALRTLIKKGDAKALALLGVTGKAEAKVEAFAVSPPTLALGDRVSVSARIASSGESAQKIVADYAIHYVKKNGSASRKVFKLKTFTLEPGGEQVLSISQTIRDFTTRTHNAGFHEVDLMLNGEIVARGGFELAI
ncbi:DNA alkylation repair protein [Mesorhizobium sp. CAU 1741]|uniref:DNA alkylation repair protein n=1 Tax=Mesorhizobium sp. CAU 1741 TaxID=3140366 RepID=UPI00325A5C1D